MVSREKGPIWLVGEVMQSDRVMVKVDVVVRNAMLLSATRYRHGLGGGPKGGTLRSCEPIARDHG
jgi:hypothetical protein